MIDNETIRKLNKVLRKQIVQKFGVLAVALLVIGSVAALGAQRNQDSHAASVGALSMSPASGSYATGANISVTLTSDSGTDTVNAVQASVTYNAAQLQYVSMSEGTAFPDVAANSTGTLGVVRVGRSTTTPVSGSNAIVTLTFKVLSTSGTASLAYDPAFSFIVRSEDNVNVLSSSQGATYTVKLPAPTLTSLSPTTGSTTGGTAVTITGTNFVSGATVKVGGTAATAVTYGSSTSLTATIPAHAAGASDVVVTNPDGQTATKTAGFSYVLPDPTATGMTPNTGTSLGGTSVTISGANFVSGAVVRFGGTVATSSTFISASSITAVAPAHAAGANSVTVTFPSGLVITVPGTYTYVLPAPTVSSVSPAVGASSGGTTITVSGANFAAITDVKVGGISATNIVVSSTTSLTAVTSSHAAGLVDVSVTNTTGTATKTGAFTYRNPAPIVSAVSPASGTANGGTTVTVTGANFTQGATVAIGGINASNALFVNSTTITARAPAHASGPASVVVTNPDSQTGALASGFLFIGLGDANNDGRVNAIDLSILITHDAENYPAADFNGDGTVGSADMAILLGRWTW